MIKKKLKYICNVHTGGTPTSTKVEFWKDELLWFTPEDIGKKHLFLENSKRKISFLGSENSSAKLITAPAVIMTTRAPVGNLGVSFYDFTTNQGCKSLTPLRDDINIMFIYYQLLGMNEWLNAISTGTTFLELSTYNLKNIILHDIDFDVQNIICSFLDNKTYEIDQLILLKDNQIQLLEEQRLALITEVLTKGLDSEVEMKDSGIEWIGDIPSHWSTTKLKYVTDKIIDGTHSTPKYIDEGIPFLRVTDITQSKNDVINMENIKYISFEENNELVKRCDPKYGDLLVSKNGTIGIPKVVNWRWDFNIFVSLCLIRPNKKVISEFLFYVFKSFIVTEQISFGQKKSTINNLHLEKIKEFYFFLPSIDEQNEICEYLNKKTKQIDDLQNKLTIQIEKVKEYRRSLIHEAVTGKIPIEEMKKYLREVEEGDN